MSEVFKQLTWLSAREEFIQFCCREVLKRFIILLANWDDNVPTGQ
jgi:hypothetical protein